LKKLTLGKNIKPPLNTEYKRNIGFNKSPSVSRNKTIIFSTKSAQIPKREKSKSNVNRSPSKNKLNMEKTLKNLEIRTSNNYDNKSFLSNIC